MYSSRYAKVFKVFKQKKNVKIPRRNRSNKVSLEVKEQIDQISNPLMSKRNVKRLVDRFDQTLTYCLEGKETSMKCINTFVQDFPNGTERGKFLALDLGGTNFRALLMNITEQGEYASFQKTAVPVDVRSSGGHKLFEFMASFTKECLSDRVEDVGGYDFPTVISFSFPVNQTSIDRGTIVSFSKGYDCHEVIGKDLGELITQAFAKAGIHIKLLGIINDTVGTMISSRWSNPSTAGGIVLGTGTNACYLEKSSKLKGLDPEKPQVVVNTEWGAFGEKGELDFIKTPFDLSLDDQSNNPGKHTMEKMVSGMYIGELIRHALRHLGQRNMFCSKDLCNALQEPNSFPTKIISKLEEEEKTGNCILCKPIKKYYRQKSSIEMLKDELLGKDSISTIKIQDFHIINEVCRAVVERGARMMGIAIGCMARRLDEREVVFGIDGTMYEKTMTYRKIIPEVVKEVAPDKEVELVMEENGSIKGAAYLAATINSLR